MGGFFLIWNEPVPYIVVVTIIAGIDVDDDNEVKIYVRCNMFCFYFRLTKMAWPLNMWRKLPKLKCMGDTFHTSPACSHVIKLTRLRVVDNSEIGKQAMAEGKPPKCIHIYNKKGVGTVGTYKISVKYCFQSSVTNVVTVCAF
jgi:hypothetical protein